MERVSIVLGSDIRIKIYGKTVNGSNETPYNIDGVVQLEYWIYTNKSKILKYHKGTQLKPGYSGLIIRDNASNYHLNVKGDFNKELSAGILSIDVMISLNDSELTEFKYLETINTNVTLIKKPISI
jgi:hypothetical protein